MQPKRTLIILLTLFLASAACFLFWNLDPHTIAFHLPRRAIKLAALCITGTALAVSTSVFQTVSGNTILTPSILGLDSLYLLVQSIIVFFLGSNTLLMMNRTGDYFLSVAVMVVFSLALFSLLMGKRSPGISLVLLLGMMFGQLFGGLSSFFQLLIDPNEFLTIQTRMFASFTTINTSLLFSSSLIVGVLILILAFHCDTLDVLSLGREIAINVGVNHHKASRLLLILVSILTAVATALVGPVTFLGLLVVSLSRHLAGTYRHAIILPASCLLAMTSLILGQFLFERVFQFNTPISVIINFLGGLYFLSLLITRRNV